MIQPRRDLDLALEPVAVHRRLQFRAQNLDRDPTTVLEIFGDEDRRHPAASNLGLDGILIAQCFAQFFQNS